MIPIELGRGCIFRCKFCRHDTKFLGKKNSTYLRRYESVLNEVLDHHTKWGTTRFYYIDDTVNESITKIQMLVDIAKEVPFNLEWVGYLRAELIWSNPKTSDMLVDSGLKSAFFGIESFESKSSKMVGKGWSGTHGKSWLLSQRKIWGNDVTWTNSMIVGLTGQTFEYFKDTDDWFMDNDMHNWQYIALWLNSKEAESEFEKDPGRYGYTFPDPERPLYWENGFWNQDLARMVADRLSSRSWHRTKETAFGLANLVSLGFSFNEISGLYKPEFKKLSIEDKKKDFLSSYIEYQMKCSPR